VVTDDTIRVEQGRLVLPSGCELPQRCVVTNQPVSVADMIFTRLGYSPPWICLLLFISGPLFVVIFMATRKRCVIKYGLNRAIRKRYREWFLMKFLVSCALLASFIACFTLELEYPVLSRLLIVAFLLFLVSLIWLFTGNSVLTVGTVHQGMFWIQGFSPEYLARLEIYKERQTQLVST
jgi:hypothetical protein